MKTSILRWSAACMLTLVLSPVTAAGMHKGVVVETMDSGGYTYAKVDEAGKQLWIAGPPTTISKGDEVSFSEQMRMESFTSSTLNRTFDELLFVGAIHTGSAPAAAPMLPHPPLTPAATAVAEPIAKAEGGYTVAELYDQKDALKGKTVTARW